MTQRQIDNPDAVIRFVRDDPVEACDHVARAPRPVAAEHLDADEMSAWRNAALVAIRNGRRRTSLAGHDPRDVRPMAKPIQQRRIIRDEADRGNDLVYERGVRRNTGIDDGDANATTSYAAIRLRQRLA